jgi:uncharacterized membrane protein
MDLLYCGVAIVMALATYGLLRLCGGLMHQNRGDRQ